MYPDGTVDLVGADGPEFRDLPAGTKIIPTGKTKELLGTIPNYAEGTGINTAEYFGNWREKFINNADMFEAFLAAVHKEYINPKTLGTLPEDFEFTFNIGGEVLIIDKTKID